MDQITNLSEYKKMCKLHILFPHIFICTNFSIFSPIANQNYLQSWVLIDITEFQIFIIGICKYNRFTGINVFLSNSFCFDGIIG